MEILEFAKIINVPILRAGSFHPSNVEGRRIDVPESQIDEMIQSFEACEDIIQESIVTGIYRENPELMEKVKAQGKPIPGLLNLNHQVYLKDTIKNACKDIVVSFGKQVIGGVNWLVATLDRVPADIVHYLQEKYSHRSIEYLGKLYHPEKKTTFFNVPRSVSFLDPQTTPAVGGQNPSLNVEFQAGESVITLFSHVELTEQQQEQHEVSIMAEKDKKDLQTPITPPASPPKKEHKDGEQVSVHEFEEMKTKITESERQAKEAKAEAEAAKVEAKTAQEQWQGEREKREAAEIVQFCTNLQHEQHASPASIKLIQPILEQLDNADVIEFAEDKKQTARQAVEEVFKSLIVMKKDESLIVPIGEFAADAVNVEKPGEETSRAARQLAKIVEFTEAAKAEASNPNDVQEVYGIQLRMAIAAEPALYG